VVRLADDGETPAGQPADQIDAPQGTAVVERLGEQRPGELAQLGGPGRRRERQRVDMIGDVEGRVVHPVRVAEAERRVGDRAAEARNGLEPGVDVAAQRGERRRRAVDAHRPADVQRGLGRLQVQEGEVEGGEAVGGRHEERVVWRIGRRLAGRR
jgi:hypothetical protein